MKLLLGFHESMNHLRLGKEYIMAEGTRNAFQSDVVYDLVKSSILQARKSHQAYIEMSEKMQAQAAEGGEAVFNEKALGLARHDAEVNFDYALSLLDIGSEEEALKLQDEHASKQGEEMSRRVAELQEMAKTSEAAAQSQEKIKEPEADNSAQRATVAAAAALGAAAAGSALTGAGNVGNAEQGADGAMASAEAEAKDIEAEIEALSAKIHNAKHAQPATSEAVAPVEEEETILKVSEAATIDPVATAETPAVVAEQTATSEAVAPVEEEETILRVSEAASVAPAATVETPAVATEMAQAVVEKPDMPEGTQAVVETPATGDAESGTAAPSASSEPLATAATSTSEEFDAELSARLDAVRAMLQGSAS